MRATGRLRRLEQAARRRRGGDDGQPQFWVLRGDGFARCGDHVISEHEFAQVTGDKRTFTLRLGDRYLDG